MSFQYKLNSITPSYLEEVYNKWTTRVDDLIKSIADNGRTVTMENTIKPLYLTEFDYPGAYLNLIEKVHPDKVLRDVAQKLHIQLQKFTIDLSFNFSVFQAYKKFIDNKSETYHPEIEKVLKDTMRDYKRKGFYLEKDKRDRVKDIQKELTELESDFSKRVDETTEYLVFTKEELEGIPETWFVGKEMVTEEGKTGYKVTTKYPDYVPFVENVVNSEFRRAMMKLYSNRGGKENIDTLNKAVKLRTEMAELLEYETYADYATEVNMIKNGDNALAFLNEFKQKLKEPYLKELEELNTYAISHPKYPLKKSNLEAWDISFYKKLMKEEVNEYSEEEVKQYFPVNTVVSGTLAIYQKVLKLRFELENVSGWHDDLMFYKVIDEVSGETNGHFFLDLHPRDGKYSHAAAFPVCFPYDKSEIGETGRSETLAGMVCNFPSTEPMRMNDVETFFHEFGHVMHFVNAKPKLASHNSFGVEHDFVEFPSQMFENWVYVRSALDLLSKHVYTDKPLPDHLLEKVKKANRFMMGMHYTRQLVYGLFDMRLHHLTEDDVDALKLFKETYMEMTLIEHPDDMLGISNFGHIMGGYQAGYYGYLYSEGMSTTAYMVRFKDKELDEMTGYEYRMKVFEKGSSVDSRELYDDFVGEREDPKYLLEMNGLL